MLIQKLILTCIVFASALLGSVRAADKPVTQADMDRLQEQVRTLDKELAVQREAFVRKLDDVEKRQSEITAQQANSLAAIANQTTTVGNYIAATSVVITILVFGAGLITYFSATSRAKEEARTASALWFNEHSADHTTTIKKLQKEVQLASSQVETHKNSFMTETSSASAEVAEARRLVLDSARASADGKSDAVINLQAVNTIRQESEALKTKPESEFTADNFYARGLAHLSSKNAQSALAAFEYAISSSKQDATVEQIAQYLLAKGVALGALGRSEEAISVYNEIDLRFGKDTSPAVRTQVANGLFNKGVRLDFLGKSEQAIAVYNQVDQRFGNDATPGTRRPVASGLINKGKSLGLQGRYAESADVFDQIDPRFGKDSSPELRLLITKALSGLSFVKILQAKESWTDQPKREKLLTTSIALSRRALEQNVEDDRAVFLGNLGYALFLASDRTAAEVPTLECLQSGGQKSFNVQLADANLHRVEPEDSQYEELLNKLWQSLPS